MKRLFRTSKSTVDPLPPPTSAGAESHDGSEAYTPRSAQYYNHASDNGAHGGRMMENGTDPHMAAGHQAGAGGGVRKSASGMKLDAYPSHPTTPSSAGEAYHSPPQAAPEPAKGKGWFSSNNPYVTPFPIVLGGPVRRLSRREKKDKVSSIPTMAEMNARPSMNEPQERDRDRERERMIPPPLPSVREGQRSRGNSGAVAPTTSVPQRVPGAEGGRQRSSSRFYEGDLPPDLRPAPPPKSPQMANHVNQRQSPDPHARQSSPPLPVPVAPAMQGYTSGRSSPTSQNLYLPPGARPPTPPHAVRASTPTRPPFAPSSMGHSHTSVLSQSLGTGGPGGYLDLEGRDQEWERERERIGRDGRDRGYSSASGSMRGSDVESSLSHAQHGGRASKPSSHAHGHTLSSSKSPLATNAYAPDNVPDDRPLARAAKTSAPPGPPGTLFPTPQPHPYALPPGAPSPYSPMSEDGPTPETHTQNIQYAIPVNDRPYEDHLDQEMRAMQIQDKERAHAQMISQNNGYGRDKDKEKKKFWGMDMGWAGKKDKEKEKEERGKDKASAGLASPQPQYAAYDAHQERRGSDWSDGIHKGLQGMFGGQHRHKEKEKEYIVNQQQQPGQGYHQAATQQQPQQQHISNGPAMLMEEAHRGRMAGRMHFNSEQQDPAKAKDVAAAIGQSPHIHEGSA